MTDDKHIWIIGCGDIGRRVASLYKNTPVHGVVNSTESMHKCESLSIRTQQLNLDSDYSLDSMNFANSDIYYFAPPPPSGAKDTRLKRFLKKLNVLPRRIVLISTTGVYGDSGGDWIDENTPIKPQADRAVRRASAEQTMQRWADDTQCEYMILRVPGIYAEKRLPVARIKQGLPIVNADEAGFTNRIHAEDLAQACKASMECDSYNEIINVTDGSPSPMTEYFNHVADYLKLPRPPQISMLEAEKTLSAGMVSYLKESRRIRNNKMLDILGFELKYPNLATALKI